MTHFEPLSLAEQDCVLEALLLWQTDTSTNEDMLWLRYFQQLSRLVSSGVTHTAPGDVPPPHAEVRMSARLCKVSASRGQTMGQGWLPAPVCLRQFVKVLKWEYLCEIWVTAAEPLSTEF